MLDSLQILNDALTYHAANSETADDYERGEALIEHCRAMVGPTDLHRGLMAVSQNPADRVRREHDVQRSLMEAVEVRRML